MIANELQEQFADRNVVLKQESCLETAIPHGSAVFKTLSFSYVSKRKLGYTPVDVTQSCKA